MLDSNLVLLPHEIKHYELVNKLASECTLFLKRDNNAFPIDKPCKVALFGSGARHTYKGGTGSGDVNSHFFNNIEKELEIQGFEITSKKWLDEYDVIRKKFHQEFVKLVKKEAREKHIAVPAYAVGQNSPEYEYDLSVKEYDGDICIYVLGRISGEGTDKRKIKGDVFLTDREVEDILYLNKKFEKFILVLNVSGVVDLTPVLEIKNIFLLSQLGVVTSSVLVDVLLGKANPSGKLSTTWARFENYPFANEFGDKDETRYKEGIYVGYRYFDSKKIDPYFEFGFGKSYSDFKYEIIDASNSGENIALKVKVTNTSNYPGKEVIQLYLSIEVKTNTAYQSLVAFNKTSELKPNESETISLSCKLSDFPIYDERKHSYVLEQGRYLFRVGISSRNTVTALLVELDEDVIIKEVENISKKPDFNDLVIQNSIEFENSQIKTIKLQKTDFSRAKCEYFAKFNVKIPEFIKSLTTDELILLSLGDYKTGLAGIIGQAGSLVPGAAGETSLRVNGLSHALVMADGPAGLRLISEYLCNDKGTYYLKEDSILNSIKPYLPGFVNKLIGVEKNKKKKGNHIYQYTTAIPIATALAQSFNTKLLFEIGRLVKEEMKIYDVDVWLAPGMNIHRNILCGRNFEYYSEDPFLSGVCASSIVNGVQKDSNKMCTIKHFTCNNQETNRFNSNSIVSERALREIYLFGFRKAIKDSNPLSLMSSYNLVNGEHVSSSYDLLTKFLRFECGYQGLIMTDWIATKQTNDKSSKYPCKYASLDLMNGNNLIMPGSKKDIVDIKKALKSGELTREDLENNAAIVYQFIEGIKIYKYILSKDLIVVYNL